MRDLFFSECRRFRNAALIFATVHLLLQLFANRLTDFLQLGWDAHVVVLFLFMLSGLGFALYQLGRYRQPARWTWLLHRPLPRPAIFGAIAGASGALILFAVGLPALLAVFGADSLTARTVDLRHYMAVLHLVLLTMIAWLAGACVILGRSRSAIVILLLPAVMLSHLASSFAMLAPALACVALLAFVAYGSFKPDRMAPPAGAGMLAAMAAPLALGFYFALVWGGSVAFQLGQMLADVHPLNRAVAPAGGFVELSRAEDGAAFPLGLAASSDPRAAHWRRQLALMKAGDIEPDVRQFPVRHQASNVKELSWADEPRHVVWTFSHDAMRFHGSDTRTGHDRGWLGLRGVGDTQPFPAVPLLPQRDLVMTPQQLYRFDAGTGAMNQLIGLAGAEVLVTPLRAVGAHRYTLTNMRLLVHPAADDSGAVPVLYAIDLPGPVSDLYRIDIAELLDGTLLSFNYGRKMVDGAGLPAQVVMFVGATGKAQVVAQRALAHDFPALFEHRAWWVSPVLHAALALPDALLDSGKVPDRARLAPQRPVAVAAAAALTALLAALGAWRWLRNSALPARRRAGWIAGCAVLGLPALACLMVLQPRAPRPQVLPLAATAAA